MKLQDIKLLLTSIMSTNIAPLVMYNPENLGYSKLPEAYAFMYNQGGTNYVVLMSRSGHVISHHTSTTFGHLNSGPHREYLQKVYRHGYVIKQIPKKSFDKFPVIEKYLKTEGVDNPFFKEFQFFAPTKKTLDIFKIHGSFIS